MNPDSQSRPPPGLRRSLSPAHHPPRPHSSAATSEPQQQQQQQYHTSLVAQSQWTRIPEAYRPKHWVRPSASPWEKPLPATPDQSHTTTAVSPTSSYDPYLRAGEPSSSTTPPRRRLRPDQFLSTTRPEQRASDSSMAYSTSFTYEPPMTSRSAPEDFQRASRSSDSPSLVRRSSSLYSQLSPSSAMLPRSPTFPPSASRRNQSSATVTDPAFQDEEEFRLFVDATTGLGPLPTFRQGSLSTASALSPGDQYTMSGQSLDRSVASSSTVHIPRQASPVHDIPTTHAHQHSGQATYHARSGPAYMTTQTRRPDQRQEEYHEESDDEEESLPIDISDSGLGGFGPPPQREHAWLDTETPMPDDELPDYATSQAEAHAAQRHAAARRAQELQRRWQQGGRKYGSEN